MRSGTTSLHRALALHPEVGMPTRKEVQYFDMNYHRGANWYRAFFPIGNRVTVDISPTYMNHPESAHRAVGLVPEAKVVVLLRDPVERAWSLYRLRCQWGHESRTFDEAVGAELAGDFTDEVVYDAHWEIPYLKSGLYAAQLRPWIEVFGRDRVLIVDSEDLFNQPSDVLTEIQEFMGITPVDLSFPHINAATDQTPSRAIERVQGYYDESDAELSLLTGQEFSWM
jgi:hypothetical protein